MKTNIAKLKQPRARPPQLNIEVSEDVRDTVKIASIKGGKHMYEWCAEVLEMAAKYQIEKGRLPFDSLLTPSSNNALTEAGQPSNIIALTDGVVAQLVEHHNGIVAAKTVSPSSSSKIVTINDNGRTLPKVHGGNSSAGVF